MEEVVEDHQLNEIAIFLQIPFLMKMKMKNHMMYLVYLQVEVDENQDHLEVVEVVQEFLQVLEDFFALEEEEDHHCLSEEEEDHHYLLEEEEVHHCLSEEEVD